MTWKIFLLCTIILISIAQNILPQEKTECIKTFKFTGPDKNGSMKEIDLQVKKRYNDFKPETMADEMKYEKNKYSDFDYTFLDSASELYDCAGYVMRKLWNTGKYRIGGPNFSSNIVYTFGKPVSGLTGWGSVQKGDIVVYEKDGLGNHIAIVKDFTTSLGVTTSVTIETKDGSESIYTHTLPDYTFRNKVGLLNDPLMIAWGIPSIYRINPNEVKISENSSGECDGESANDLDEKIAGVWYKTGYKMTLSGSSSNINLLWEQVPPVTDPKTATTVDPRKFTNVRIEGDKITGRYESDPMYYDNFLNQKGKVIGSFEMKLVQSSFGPENDRSSLEGTSIWEGDYCKGCSEGWIWSRVQK